jgi:hypothetical protein
VAAADAAVACAVLDHLSIRSLPERPGTRSARTRRQPCS